MSLPTLAYPSTVVAKKKRLAEVLQGTDQSVQACDTLDTGTRASWGLFYVTVLEFTRIDPSWWQWDGYMGAGSMLNQAVAYEQELFAWQKRVQGAGCTLTTPLWDPTPTETPSQTVTFLQYAAFAAIAIAGAYTVGKVVEVAEIAAPRRLPKRAA